jgi:hypothetical protein
MRWISEIKSGGTEAVTLKILMFLKLNEAI